MKKQILCLLILWSFSGWALAEDKCSQQAAHTAMTYVLIDRSDKIADLDGFNKSFTALSSGFQAGERVVVGLSTDKVADTKVLIDFVKPEESVWTSTLKIRALQRQFAACLDQSAKDAVSEQPKFEKSALAETLSFVSRILQQDSSASKRLMVYSDMIQNSSALSLYSLHDKDFNTPALLKRLEQEKLVPSLPNVAVYVAGAGARSTEKRGRLLEEFWRAYFEKAGASVKFFGPVLLNL